MKYNRIRRKVLAAPLHETSAEFSFTTKAIPETGAPLQNRDGHTTAAIVEKRQISRTDEIQEFTPAIALLGLADRVRLGRDSRDVARTRQNGCRRVSRRLARNDETRGISSA